MKKDYILRSLFALLFIVAGITFASADEYAFTFTKSEFTANATKKLGGVNWTLAGDGGYWGFDSTKGQQFGSKNKPYKTLTLSTAEIPGTITQIKLNTSGASSTNAKVAVSVGGTAFGSATSLTSSAKDFTFTGEGSGTVELKWTQTSAKAIYLKSISITYSQGGGEPVAVEVPVFTSTGDEYSSHTVTLSCETEGADIYYTLDGTDPIENGVEYTAPIKVEKTTTIKAVATDGTEYSSVATKTYEVYPLLESIAAFLATNTTTTSKTDVYGIEEVQVVYQYGSYLYLTDGTTGLQVYGSVGKTYQNGDILLNIYGSVGYYSGTYQMVPVASTFTQATQGDPVEPTVVALADVSKAMMSQYIRLEGVTWNGSAFTDGTNTLEGYKRFDVALPTEQGNYNVEGLVSVFNSKVQIYPTSIEKIAAEAPTIYADKASLVFEGCVGEIEAQTITLTTENVTGEITVENSNKAAFAVTNDGNVYTVSVIATAEGKYEGTLTFATDGAEDVVVELSATITAPKLNATYDFTKPAALNASGTITLPEAGEGFELGSIYFTDGHSKVSMTEASGNTKNRIWNASGKYDLRLYTGATITISGKEIVSLTITGADIAGLTATEGTFEDGMWSGVADAVTFKATKTVKISTISVTYGYRENIESEKNYFLLPDEDWKAGEGNYHAQFINKNTGAYAEVDGESFQDGDIILFYLSQYNHLTRSGEMPVYTHVIFTRGEKTSGELYFLDINKYTYDMATNEWIADGLPTDIERVEMSNNIGYANGVVAAEGAIEVYNINGVVVARGNDTIDLRNMNRGIYIVRNGDQVRKVVR